MMEFFSSYTLSSFLQGTTSVPLFNIKISWVPLMLLEISKERSTRNPFSETGRKGEWEGMLWNSGL